MNVRRPRTLSAIGTVLLVIACGEPTEPTPTADISGEYTLVRFNGDTLPATAAYPDAECAELTVVSGALTLDAPDAFTLRQTYRHTAACGQESEEVRRTVGGTYATDSVAGALSVVLKPVEDAPWWPMTGTADSAGIELEPAIPAADADAAVLRSFGFEKR